MVRGHLLIVVDVRQFLTTQGRGNEIQQLQVVFFTPWCFGSIPLMKDCGVRRDEVPIRCSWIIVIKANVHVMPSNIFQEKAIPVGRYVTINFSGEIVMKAIRSWGLRDVFQT